MDFDTCGARDGRNAIVPRRPMVVGPVDEISWVIVCATEWERVRMGTNRLGKEKGTGTGEVFT